MLATRARGQPRGDDLRDLGVRGLQRGQVGGVRVVHVAAVRGAYHVWARSVSGSQSLSCRQRERTVDEDRRQVEGLLERRQGLDQRERVPRVHRAVRQDHARGAQRARPVVRLRAPERPSERQAEGRG